MRFSGLAYISLLVNLAQAFLNAAPLYVQLDEEVDSFKQFSVFSNYEDIAIQFGETSSKICASENPVPLIVFRVPFSSKDYLEEITKDLGVKKVSEHVLYEGSETYLKTYKPCTTAFEVNLQEFPASEFFVNEDKPAPDALSIRIPRFAPIEYVKEYIQDLSVAVNSLHGKKPNLIIQGLPYKHSNIERDEDFRFIDIVDDIEASNVVAAFYLEAESTIPNVLDVGTKSNSSTNLFTDYQFFTPGIWMGTIVSLFLAWILANTLSWTSDLKISYKAFEKQVDHTKKIQ